MRHPHLKGQPQSTLPLEFLGKEIKVWWNTGKVNEVGENIGTILDVQPYTGLYDEHYDCVLVINCTSRKGKLEMAYRSSDFSFDKR